MFSTLRRIKGLMILFKRVIRKEEIYMDTGLLVCSECDAVSYLKGSIANYDSAFPSITSYKVSWMCVDCGHVHNNELALASDGDMYIT